MGKHRTRLGLCYWFRSLHGARNARSDEHESSTDESWIVRLGDQQTGQGESSAALPLESCALIARMKDFVCGHIRAIRRACCI